MACWIGASVTNAGEDTLGDYEGEIEKREEQNHHDGGSSGCVDDGTGATTCPGGGLGALLGGLFQSLEPGEGIEGSTRLRGLPASAAFRVESSYQHLARSDVQGLVTRAEAIYHVVGVGGEFVRYWEDSPNQHLDVASMDAVLRLVATKTVRFTLVAGAREIAGRHSHWGAGGGLGLGLYPTDWLGFEADARGYRVSDRRQFDLRIGALFRIPRFPYLAVRGGYRALLYQGESLDGPEIGLVATW